ncbi:hypothetical protein ACFP65_04110 [Marinilactibacillus sp. GCM10026970]|uniref:hypothetical protein n=1 Tax=Marinilactibacillus sp. GCM10026970 TaxID=3252642 RepID=UPI0036121B38
MGLNSIVALLLLAGGIWLQIFLSKSEKKWPGLVIPVMFFICSFLPILSMGGYTIEESSVTYIDDEGNEVTEVFESEPIYDDTSTGEYIVMGVFALFIFNVPTAICLAIYYSVRDKTKKSNQVNKTRIQDL